LGGYDGYSRLGLAGEYRIGLNILHTGKTGVKGLFLEYGEYSGEYSPTSLPDFDADIFILARWKYMFEREPE